MNEGGSIHGRVLLEEEGSVWKGDGTDNIYYVLYTR